MLADFPFFYSEVYTSRQVVHKGGTSLNVTPQNNDVKYSIWYFLTRSQEPEEEDLVPASSDEGL